MTIAVTYVHLSVRLLCLGAVRWPVHRWLDFALGTGKKMLSATQVKLEHCQAHWTIEHRMGETGRMRKHPNQFQTDAHCVVLQMTSLLPQNDGGSDFPSLTRDNQGRTWAGPAPLDKT